MIGRFVKIFQSAPPIDFHSQFTVVRRCRNFSAYSDADDAKLQTDLAEGYLRFLQAKDENKRMEGTRLAKRTKKAKVRGREGIHALSSVEHPGTRAYPPGCPLL